MHVTLDTQFDEENQLQSYKNEIAKDLNQCIRAAKHLDFQGWFGCAESLVSTAQRVAEFENIKMKP
jgi:hypothetical protein